MGTVTKTLKLLDFFSNDRPSIGLTEFVKLSGYDKATTHRRLTELVSSGFLEQDLQTRAYRLGPAIMRLAYVRERIFPIRESAMPTLRRLSEVTQETVHISLIQGREGLGTLAHLESTAHGMRVYIDESELLPFHATSSGLATLAFTDDSLLEHVLSKTMATFTKNTITQPDKLKELVESTRQSGFAIQCGGFEDQVHGIATPLFDNYGNSIGAVAVATPKTRLTDEHIKLCKNELKKATRDITASWGGRVPDSIEQAWGREN